MSPKRKSKIKARLFRNCSLCYVCGKPLMYKDATLEHIFPKALGGETKSSNLALSHLICNQKKGIQVINL